MLDLIRNRLRQGIRTQAFPKGPAPELPERFRGRPTRDPAMSPRDSAGLDLGTCLFSPEEAATYTRDYRMAVARREDLAAPTGEVELARALDERSRRLFGRSLRLRSVVAGSCGGCEAELVALGNVVFDLARFGVQFVASPRHADGIVIIGAMMSSPATSLSVRIPEDCDEDATACVSIESTACASDEPADICCRAWLPSYCVFLTNITTWLTPALECSVNAWPMTRPARVAFIATPGVEDVVSQSPGLMGPFSSETQTGTRPARARYTLRPGPSLSPNTKPGAVEMTPSAVLSYADEERFTRENTSESNETTVPGATASSVV